MLRCGVSKKVTIKIKLNLLLTKGRRKRYASPRDLPEDDAEDAERKEHKMGAPATAPAHAHGSCVPFAQDI